jgi:hypothetical protein
MNEQLKRRSLLPVQPPQAAREVSEAAIAAVANRNGFQSVATPEQQDNEREGTLRRRQRQPTGRDHQFNVRLKRETLDFIYAEANSRNVPVAQVVEDMAEALKVQKSR